MAEWQWTQYPKLEEDPLHLLKVENAYVDSLGELPRPARAAVRSKELIRCWTARVETTTFFLNLRFSSQSDSLLQHPHKDLRMETEGDHHHTSLPLQRNCNWVPVSELITAYSRVHGLGFLCKALLQEPMLLFTTASCLKKAGSSGETPHGE